MLCRQARASDVPQITLRFSHVVAEETPKGLAARRFKALVEKASNSRIAVQIFPDGQLYGDHDEMQALQLGAVDLLAPSLSKFGRIGLPEFELFYLPFLFDDIADVRRITGGSLGQRLLKRLERQGLVDVHHRLALGDLEAELVRRKARLLQHGGDRVGQLEVAQRLR